MTVQPPNQGSQNTGNVDIEVSRSEDQENAQLELSVQPGVASNPAAAGADRVTGPHVPRSKDDPNFDPQKEIDDSSIMLQVLRILNDLFEQNIQYFGSKH